MPINKYERSYWSLSFGVWSSTLWGLSHHWCLTLSFREIFGKVCKYFLICVSKNDYFLFTVPWQDLEWLDMFVDSIVDRDSWRHYNPIIISVMLFWSPPLGFMKNRSVCGHPRGSSHSLSDDEIYITWAQVYLGRVPALDLRELTHCTSASMLLHIQLVLYSDSF